MADFPPERSSETVCGVDRSIVEKFLVLIRDNYKDADKATFFLEQRTGILNVQGIANLRDVLSHLATLLNPSTPEEKRLEQLANAEEHIRRAIIEPYEVALYELLAKFESLYEEYKAQVIPVRQKHVILQNAPNTISIEATLTEIRSLIAQGRMGKGKNLWNPEWEVAVTSFATAFDKLSVLYNELEGHWYNFEQIKRDRRSTVFNVISIVLGLLGIVLAVAFVLFPTLSQALRDVLGIG